MKSLPLISIIIPVYNVEQYLQQCIESIIAQTFQDWELLLVDDGSTDRSGAICDGYASKDERITVFHKENTGLSDTRNVGISLAKAEWIGFVDSDDWIEKDMYEVMYQACLAANAEIAISGYFMDYEDKSIPSCVGGNVVVYNRDEALWLILEDKIVKSFACDKLFKRSVISDLFPKYYSYEDYATIFKWFVGAQHVVRIETAKYHYRQRKGSIRNDKNPEKVYHFFLAEIERYYYVVTHSLLIKKRPVLAAKVIKTGITQAKGIVRQSDESSQAFEYLRKIKSALNDYIPIGRKNLKTSDYLKFLRLTYMPFCFYCEVYLHDKLKSLKKKPETKLYK